METHDCGRAFVHLVKLGPLAPVSHTTSTREIDHPYRVSSSLVLRTPFRRYGRWAGFRASWISLQIKLPIGPRLLNAGAWGIVLGWWRRNPSDDEWVALMNAVRLDHEVDKADEREFTDPDFSDRTNEDRGIGIVVRRRVDDPGHAGPDE